MASVRLAFARLWLGGMLAGSGAGISAGGVHRRDRVDVGVAWGGGLVFYWEGLSESVGRG